MKICKTCEESKPETKEFFGTSVVNGKTYFRGSCRECTKKLYYGPERQAANREYYLKRWREHKDFINQQKTPCIVCGFKHPEAIDFHHIDPSTKSFELAKAGTRGLDTIKAEIAKCVCLCSNCHRMHHAGIIPLEDHLP